MQIDLESIPQAPMLRQGALIHRVDHWAQSKVWNPQVLFMHGNAGVNLRMHTSAPQTNSGRLFHVIAVAILICHGIP